MTFWLRRLWILERADFLLVAVVLATISMFLWRLCAHFRGRPAQRARTVTWIAMLSCLATLQVQVCWSRASDILSQIEATGVTGPPVHRLTVSGVPISSDFEAYLDRVSRLIHDRAKVLLLFPRATFIHHVFGAYRLSGTDVYPEPGQADFVLVYKSPIDRQTLQRWLGPAPRPIAVFEPLGALYDRGERPAPGAPR